MENEKLHVKKNLFVSEYNAFKYRGIILIRGANAGLLSKIWRVRADVISLVTGLLLYNAKYSLLNSS